jgi:hypothetical protein
MGVQFVPLMGFLIWSILSSRARAAVLGVYTLICEIADPTHNARILRQMPPRSLGTGLRAPPWCGTFRGLDYQSDCLPVVDWVYVPGFLAYVLRWPKREDFGYHEIFHAAVGSDV